MTSRPNFFLLLGLNPNASWDQAQFDSILREKRGEWSRQSATVAKRALVAQQNLALIPKIREVMNDPEAREQEAIAARAELLIIHQAACKQFERQLAFINAKEIVEQDEVDKFIEAFQPLFSSEEIMSRLRVKVNSPDDVQSQNISTLDPSTAKRVDERLQFIHVSTLYELLQLSNKTATSELFQTAEDLYTKLVVLAPTAEISAKIELAGLAREIFKSDEMRSRYDESLRRTALDRLFGELDDSIGRSKDKEVHQKQVLLFLNEAKKDGWQEEDALERLKEHVRFRKWIMMAPGIISTMLESSQQYGGVKNVSNVTYQNLGSVLRLRWEWPEGCQEVYISYSTKQRPQHDDPLGVTQIFKRVEYDRLGHYDISNKTNEDYHIVISSVEKREDEQIVAQGIYVHVRQASKTVVSYILKASTLFRGRYIQLITEPCRKLPAALLLISKQGELPFRKIDGKLLYRIEGDVINNERTIIDLPDTPLSPKTFGKLFFEDDRAYNECILHHPGESFMRLS
jgi:hypothetical protein